MTQETEEELRKAFRELHNPERPVYHIGHARRGNKAEDYDPEKVLGAGARLLKYSIKAAHGVISNFARHARKVP